MRYVFAVVAVFLRSLFAVAVRFCHNNRRVDEQTPLLVEDTAERSSGVHASDISRYHSYAYVEPNTEPDVPPPSGDVQVHDAEPNSSRYSFAAQSNGFRVDVESSGVPEVLVQVAEPSEYESSPEDSPSETELKPSPTPLFVDIHGGTVSVILRALYANASVDEVSIELDGTTVDRIVEKLNDGIYSLKFSAGVHGGKIKIFAGLV
jgi:hypothetical protein